MQTRAPLVLELFLVMTNWVVQIVLQELCLYVLENSGCLCSWPSPAIIKGKKKNLWVLVSCLGKY